MRFYGFEPPMTAATAFAATPPRRALAEWPVGDSQAEKQSLS